MSYEPTVAVVVAARNAAQTIEDCVRSLLELRYPAAKLELRVVDNGSSDATAELARAARVTVQHELLRGAAAARNAGIAAARAEVVAFTDADCVVDPDWLRLLVEPLADPSVGIAGGAIRACEPANHVERFGDQIHDHRKSIEVYEPPYAITMNWASPRRLLLELGGFDVRFRRCQDVDLSYRVSQAGYALAFAPGAVVFHRNESDLTGLFREGFVHGFHGVRARKRHAAWLRGYGHGRIGRPGYRYIGARLADSLRGDTRASCEAAFNGGKKAGKLLGSIRFGHLDL